MDFVSAIKSGFSNYAKFAGRARRSEYWFWQLFVLLVSMAFSAISSLDGVDAEGLPKAGIFSVLAGLTSLGLFLPSLSVLARRLHDVGRSAWHILYWGVLPGIVGLPLMGAGIGMLISGAELAPLGLVLVAAGFLLWVACSTVLFVFTLLDSKADNKYGPSPKSSKPDFAPVFEGTTA